MYLYEKFQIFQTDSRAFCYLKDIVLTTACVFVLQKRITVPGGGGGGGNDMCVIFFQA